MNKCLKALVATGLAVLSTEGVAQTSLGLPTPESTSSRAAEARTADIYNIKDYCGSPCNTVALQTAALNAVASLINTNGGGTMYVPPGHWTFNAAVAGPIIFTTFEASIVGGGTGSTTITILGGKFAEWTRGTRYPSGGKGMLANIRLYESDVPTSGAQVLLDQVNGFEISNVWMGGGFIGLDLASAVEVHGNNVTIIGDNKTSGSMGMRVHRHSSSTGNSAENNFVNLNVRGSSGRTITNALRISDSDGLWITGGHFGFSSAEAVLIEAENSTDALDNIHLTAVDFDTDSFGVHFVKLKGFTGHNGNNFITAGLAELSDNDGIRVDDSTVTALTLVNVQTLLNGANGINIQAGSHISIVGGSHGNNNTANCGASHISIGGTASYVTLDGISYELAGGSVGVASNVTIASTADYINVGPSVYSGGAVDITNASSGTHNRFGSSVTDKSTAPSWPVFVATAGGVSLIQPQSPFNLVSFNTSVSTGATDYPILQSNGSGGGVVFYGGGTRGSSTKVTVGSLAGITNVGGGSQVLINTTDGTRVEVTNNGVLYAAFASLSDPTTSDIPTGLCADWHNTKAGTYKHYCNVGGTLRSVSMD